MAENISLFVSATLDTIGYDDQMNSYRNSVHDWIKHYIYKSKETSNIETILGSKCMILDDGEVVFIKQNVHCVSHADPLSGRRANGILFQSEIDGTPPGYVRLKLLTGQLYGEDEILNSLFGKNTYYLWSLCYFNKMENKLSGCISSQSTIQPISGPSIAACYDKGDFTFPLRLTDETFATKLRSKFLNRPYGWPTERQIKDISQMDGLVVPAFSSDREYSYLEWRICYTCVEQKLFRSLNIAQVKLYILLKLIAKSTLNHISSDINSYVMKNIVFWMATIYPADIFQEKYLIMLLVTALGLLYNCILSGFIPCYITEDKNLLTGVMCVLRKRNLLEMLYTLQQERGRMLLRCKKIRCVMLMKCKSPHLIDIYERQRNKLEEMVLILDFIRAKYAACTRNSKEVIELMTANEDCLRIAKSVLDAVHPEVQEQFFSGEQVISRIREILN